jgi:hypothetical protein
MYIFCELALLIRIVTPGSTVRVFPGKTTIDPFT